MIAEPSELASPDLLRALVCLRRVDVQADYRVVEGDFPDLVQVVLEHLAKALALLGDVFEFRPEPRREYERMPSVTLISGGRYGGVALDVGRHDSGHDLDRPGLIHGWVTTELPGRHYSVIVDWPRFTLFSFVIYENVRGTTMSVRISLSKRSWEGRDVP